LLYSGPANAKIEHTKHELTALVGYLNTHKPTFNANQPNRKQESDEKMNMMHNFDQPFKPPDIMKMNTNLNQQYKAIVQMNTNQHEQSLNHHKLFCPILK
jgi:hypothetical protein